MPVSTEVLRRIVRKQWPALFLLMLMGGISTLLGYELYGRWRYAAFVSKNTGCDDLKSFVLKDGRRLSYRESGDPGGRPVFYFHGAVGSSVEWPSQEKHGLRLIGLDRPGYGCSTPQPMRSFEGWSRDVAEVADQLGWKTFRLIGFSAGAPHALAVAALLPERVERVLLVGAVKTAPFARARLLAPGISYELFSGLRDSWSRDPDGFEAQASRDLPACDLEVYRRPEILSRFKATHARALRGSVSGVYEDLRLLGKPWSFDAATVRVPVEIWHGDQDRVAPLAAAQDLSSSIRHPHFRVLRGEGHFLLYNHEQELLDDVSK